MAEKLTDYRQLNVWQKAHKLALDVYEITKKYPKDEKGELVSRMRVAAESIPIKIAEGFMRRGPRDKEAAYKQTQTGLESVKYYLMLSDELGYIKDAEEMILAAEELGRMLGGLVRSARS